MDLREKVITKGRLNVSEDIGIDLGTATVIAYTKGKGIVLREPSVVAIDRYTNEVLEYGKEAQKMIGRNPHNIDVIRPLKEWGYI